MFLKLIFPKDALMSVINAKIPFEKNAYEGFE